MDLWDIGIEPEVRAWPESLPKRQFGHVPAFAEKLAEEASTLGEPYARHLGGKVRELRIPLHPVDARVTYWLAPGRQGSAADRVPQDQGTRDSGDRTSPAAAEGMRGLTRPRHRRVRPGGVR